MQKYKGHEQPKYEVIPIHSDKKTYQLRHYFKCKWANTKVMCQKFEDGQSHAFQKLFAYIQVSLANLIRFYKNVCLCVLTIKCA